jgi:hypothetical protein
MSNYLAIATVTAALKNLISQSVQNLPSMQSAVEVMSGRPEARDNRFVGVNICLYQTTPNAYFRNQDLATRSAAGDFLQVPMVPVNLHYLITFYGKEQHQEAQRLLGATMAALHANPVLTPKQIQQTIAAESWLTGSDLHLQTAHVKLVPVGLTLEELSKLWTVFFQTSHALSVAYEAAPVLISPEQVPPVPPVVTPARKSAPTKPQRKL